MALFGKTPSLGATLKKIEASYGAPVAAILPLSEDVARMQSADIFSVRFPDHPFSQGIQGIAGVIRASA